MFSGTHYITALTRPFLELRGVARNSSFHLMVPWQERAPINSQPSKHKSQVWKIGNSIT